MATVVKDFKVKAGLVVEGATATVNGKNILREDDSDQYIIDLIGGETLVTSVDAADFVVTDGELNIAAGSDIARTGDLPTETADISESVAGPLYFTNQRALDATNAAYDAAGSAAAVASDLTDHENDTTAHGATGAVVGTTNTQTLTNKTIGDTLNFTGAGAMTINSDSHIVLTPAAGSSVKWGSDILATQSYADTAEQDAKDYADGLAGNYDSSGAAAQALTDANDYTDLLLGDATIDGTGGNTVTDRIATAVADLVDGAPALLNTLNELAEAIGDNVDAQGLAVAIGNKLPLAGGTLTGELAMGANKITGLGTPTANTDAATKSYVDDQTTSDVSEGTNLYYTDARVDSHLSGGDGISYSQGVISADVEYGLTISPLSGKIYVDRTTTDTWYDAAGTAAGLAGNYDAAGTAQGLVDALDTDDIEEGSTNLYYAAYRAKAEAASLLTNATKTNITITKDAMNDLTITAENGVADSDTDDLEEGTTNLYFTDVRAVDALEAVVPNFTAVEVNSLAKQIAATVSAPTGGSQVTAYAFPASYRSAKFLVKTAYGTHTELSEVLLTLDTSNNIAITEYAIVGTNGSSSTITADIDLTVPVVEVRLRVTPTNNTSTITVVGTLLV